MGSNIPIKHLTKEDGIQGRTCYAEVSPSSTTSYKKFNRRTQYNYSRKGGNIYDYRAIIYALNIFYVDYTIETGNKVKLPAGMGNLIISRMDKKLLPIEGTNLLRKKIDWCTTKKTGIITYFTNEHSDGYCFRWLWIKGDNFKPIHRSLWSLRMVDTRAKNGTSPKKKLRDAIREGKFRQFQHITANKEGRKKQQAMDMITKGLL